MEDDDDTKYKYSDINGRRIRVSIDNPMDVWIWRNLKTRDDYWFKFKVTLLINHLGYKTYKIKITNKNHILSRVIYKCFNNDWDITDNSENNLVDHKNINSLDNRIENLRILNHQHNQWNRKDVRGTTFIKKSGKWTARITINGKRKEKAGFKTEELAHEWYLMMKEEHRKLPE